jgi:Bacterial membrane protein YfhO
LGLGSGCTEGSRDSVTFNLPAPVKSTSIAIVARLACSTHIPDGTEMVRVSIVTADGNQEAHGFVAGRDASEWAYDCASEQPAMKHQRTKIFRSYPAFLNEQPCEGHYYVSKLKLERVQDVKSIEFKWTGSSGTVLLEKISLINETDRTSAAVDPMNLGGRWKFEMETPVTRVYENLEALPRAWLVSSVVNVDPEASLKVVITSKLPDGTDFKPLQTALVEEPVDLSSETSVGGLATIARLSDNYMEVRTSSKIANFLVTSDVYYPGWRARIDGNETHLYRANYALRGVVVPPGDHIVLFEYRPRSLQAGAVISLFSILVLGAISIGFPLLARSS